MSRPCIKSARKVFASIDRSSRFALTSWPPLAVRPLLNVDYVVAGQQLARDAVVKVVDDEWSSTNVLKLGAHVLKAINQLPLDLPPVGH
jgi:hypothetical protein